MIINSLTQPMHTTPANRGVRAIYSTLTPTSKQLFFYFFKRQVLFSLKRSSVLIKFRNNCLRLRTCDFLRQAILISKHCNNQIRFFNISFDSILLIAFSIQTPEYIYRLTFFFSISDYCFSNYMEPFRDYVDPHDI